MSNCEHAIFITPFQKMADNSAKSINTTWAEFADSLTAGHLISSDEKSCLPLFNAWRYKDISDPSVNNGSWKDGTAINQFSDTHVRRHASNLVELSMLVLDFDGALPITEVHQRFGRYEYVCYTSLNHQAEGVDKFRVVIPLANPISVVDFKRLSLKMKQWAVDQKADTSTFDIGRMFILPVVRKERRVNARAWRNHGELFEWKTFELIPNSQLLPSLKGQRMDDHQSRADVLKPNDVLETGTGSIAVRDINRKISYVRCPFHRDKKPSEFVDITKFGTPYLVCKKCGTIYMERDNSNSIVNGIAKIIEKKRIRTALEGKS